MQIFLLQIFLLLSGNIVQAQNIVLNTIVPSQSNIDILQVGYNSVEFNISVVNKDTIPVKIDSISINQITGLIIDKIICRNNKAITVNGNSIKIVNALNVGDSISISYYKHATCSVIPALTNGTLIVDNIKAFYKTKVGENFISATTNSY